MSSFESGMSTRGSANFEVLVGSNEGLDALNPLHQRIWNSRCQIGYADKSARRTGKARRDLSAVRT